MSAPRIILFAIFVPKIIRFDGSLT